MTVTMDHKNNHKRRGSWDSKMSISTVSTTTRPYSRRCGTPSSILSSDSDIRFTRKKLSSNLRCGCYVLAGFLTFLLVGAVLLYVGYTYIVPEPPTELTFRGIFRVIEGDVFTPDLADPATEGFRVRSRDYRERLNLLFRRSRVRSGFLTSEVLALDGEEGTNLVVHFDLHFDPQTQDVDESDLFDILMDGFTVYKSVYLTNLTIDPASVGVRKSGAPITPPALLQSTTQQTPSAEPPPPRKCHAVELAYCKHLPYNSTSFPNLLGHKSIEEVRNDVIAFRELVDAECYRMAYEFVCQLLQPSCVVRQTEVEDEVFMPCRSFCRDFVSGCGSRFPERVTKALDCNRFPEYEGVGSCRPKPGCVQEMQVNAMSPRVCDGIVDCEDLSDETTCSYCPMGYLHCGIGRKCIRTSSRCDGKKDCPDNSDERGCLSIAPSIKEITKFKQVTPHQSKYFSSGFVTFNEKGQYGKLCTENVMQTSENTTHIQNYTSQLNTAARSLCKSMSYQNLDSIEIVKDQEIHTPYVQMNDPTAEEITFVRTACPSKQVLYVKCGNLDCGTQPVRTTGGIEGLSKMSGHGDWPWHIALFKEDVHVCDGTLISPEWVLTTASCFQGQPKAEWIAKLGVIRVDALSPWQQTRRIVGMVKSPVEGSTIVMVKLDEPVLMSDFVRPVCLPEEHLDGGKLFRNATCNTLGWARNREQLQRIQVQITGMAKCENVSIATVNSLCTESPYFTDDCNEEEFAGSPMLCLLPDQKRWALIGISNWRIACSKAGVDRPRMYDKITSNIEWIQKTISAIT